MKKFLLFFGLSTGLVLCNAAEIPPAEKILPTDTLAVLSVPDYAKLRELNGHSPMVQFWNDPAMKPFREKFMEKFRAEYVKPLEKDLGTSLTNYSALLQGQLTLAFVQGSWQGGKDEAFPGWLLLCDTKTNSAQLKTNLADLKRKWADANKSFRTEKIRDVEFTVLRLSTNDVPPSLQKVFGDKEPVFEGEQENPETVKKPAPTIELFLGQSDSLLITGNQTNAIEKVLIALGGGNGPTLSEQSGFAADRVRVFRDAPMFGWINAKAIVEVVNRQLAKGAADDADKPSFNPFRPDKIIAATGLDALKSIAFSAVLNDEGNFFNLFLAVPESERHGLFSLIATENKETLPPAFVPASAVKYQRFRFNGSKTWDNLEKTLNNLSPQLFSTFNLAIEMAGSAAKEKNPDYNLKKSLVASLGDDFISYQKASRSTAMADMVSPPSLSLIGSPKPDQLLEALKLFIGTTRRGETPKEREFLGRKIYSIPLPPARVAGGEKSAPRVLNFCASSGYVAISTDSSILEEFLRSGENPGKPLRETAGLAEAAQKVGGSGAAWLTFENQAETMRAALAGLKENLNADTAANTGLGLLTQQKFFKEWADLTLLPDFDKIAKYFTISVGASSATPEGLALKVFAPTPPQLKK